MKKNLIAFVLFLVAINNQAYSFSGADFDEINVTKQWFSILTTFDIQSSCGSDLGYVHRKFLSHTPEYHFHDQHDHLQAVARMRFFALMPTFEVSDYDGFPMGMIHEHLHYFYPEFSITYPNGEIFATAESNFWGTKYTMYSPYFEQAIAIFTKPYISIRNRSAVHILNHSAFRAGEMDIRMVIIAATLKADVSHWKKIVKEHDKEHVHAGFGILKEGTNDSEIDALELDIHFLETMLESYELLYVNHYIDERDIQRIEELTEPFLKEISDSDITSLLEEREQVLEICGKLVVLFSDESITDSQKAALCVLLRQKLDDVRL